MIKAHCRSSSHNLTSSRRVSTRAHHDYQQDLQASAHSPEYSLDLRVCVRVAFKLGRAHTLSPSLGLPTAHGDIGAGLGPSNAAQDRVLAFAAPSGVCNTAQSPRACEETRRDVRRGQREPQQHAESDGASAARNCTPQHSTNEHNPSI